MDPDLALVLGLTVGAFSVPGMLAAITDGRSRRASAVTILIAAALTFYAFTMKPGGYELSQIPDVFFDVLAGFTS
ncbi:hypothetical protein QO034_18710 [Sedimentitalea sp. JM2-8]|uniref:Uncharacterized protein n=1 Tax=Sedimentitalea xiamensis TaxID=3050037 RepID=A0ABT7FJ12_9RHOB|nr:hypothetical protein [Sedimentitalea xiamensis]MDK3075124.1 hypothetical protein [Sedimentitalea xiamensis]